MRVRPFVFAALLATLGVGGGGTVGHAAPPNPQAERADFSGTWKLNEKLSVDPFDLIRKDGLLSGESRSERGRPGNAGADDIPLEVLSDERRLVVADDGQRVRITRGPGRQSVLVTDGEERELDDEQGPAAVVAKRKGRKGERLLISSRWHTGREVHENWELLSNPRRLAVTTKVMGRRSFTYKRIYDPALELTPEPAAVLPAAVLRTPAASADTSPAPISSTAVAPAAKPECSIRPPRGATLGELSRLSKITRREAEARAIASVAPERVSSIMTSDVEVENGCLVWPIDLRFESKPGLQEVVIDAGDGKVLSSEYVAPRTEGPQNAH
jgi:hypothetical protein